MGHTRDGMDAGASKEKDRLALSLRAGFRAQSCECVWGSEGTAQEKEGGAQHHTVNGEGPRESPCLLTEPDTYEGPGANWARTGR